MVKVTSPSKTFTVVDALYALTLNLSKTTALNSTSGPEDPIVFSGKLTLNNSPLAGKKIHIGFNPPHEDHFWWDEAGGTTATTDAQGNYSFTISFRDGVGGESATGTWQVATEWRGD
ncbi:MAG: hypothetical protein PHI12_11255 [Dehalococcoidales bacterium]|nr:hypothetical protein [Dehalococcoidales bacterium]